jgi:hypothetical protein
VAAPASGAVAAPSPTAKAIKSPGAASDAVKVGISWNATDPVWEGMYVTNGGDKPLSVVGIQLDARKDCLVRPYRLEDLKKLVGLQDAMKQWGQKAINLFGLPKSQSDSVLVPELTAAMRSHGIQPADLTIKAGGRAVIFNATNCQSVSQAIVDTGAGSTTIKFKRPYTGH